MSSSAFFAARKGLGRPTLPGASPAPAAGAADSGQPGRLHEHLQQGLTSAAQRSSAAAPPSAPAPPGFPATRAHLWDRTPAGAVTVIDLKNLRLEVRMSPSVWPLLHRLQRLQEQGSSSAAAKQAVAATLLAQLVPGGSSSTARGPLVVELTASSAGAAADAVPVPLTFAPPLPDAAVAQLGSALEVAVSRAPTPAGLASLLAARLACEPDRAGGLVLQGVAVTPAAILDFKPLLSKRVAPSPLAQRLQDLLQGPSPRAAATADADLEDGFLTMDRGRSLVPLAASDAAAYSVPLVGCWVAGSADIKHPRVTAACIRFLCSKALADKATAVDASFLLLLFPCGKAAVPLCYEAHVSLEGGALPLQAHRFTTAWRSEQALEAMACQAAPCSAPSLPLPGCPVALNQRAATPRHPGSGGGSKADGLGQSGLRVPAQQRTSQVLPQPARQGAGMASLLPQQLYQTPPATMLLGPASYGQPSPPSAGHWARVQLPEGAAGPCAAAAQAATSTAVDSQLPAEQVTDSSGARHDSAEQAAQLLPGKGEGAQLPNPGPNSSGGTGQPANGPGAVSKAGWKNHGPRDARADPVGNTGAQATAPAEPPISMPKQSVQAPQRSLPCPAPCDCGHRGSSKAEDSSSRGGSSSGSSGGSGGGTGAASVAAVASPAAAAALPGSDALEAASFPSLAAWSVSSFSVPPTQLQHRSTLPGDCQPAAPCVAGAPVQGSGSPLSAPPPTGIRLPAEQRHQCPQAQPAGSATNVHAGTLDTSTSLLGGAAGNAFHPAGHTLPFQAAAPWHTQQQQQQPSPNADVAILQQEVSLLRQEVALLRAQVQALQLVPAVAAAFPLLQQYQCAALHAHGAGQHAVPEPALAAAAAVACGEQQLRLPQQHEHQPQVCGPLPALQPPALEPGSQHAGEQRQRQEEEEEEEGLREEVGMFEASGAELAPSTSSHISPAAAAAAAAGPGQDASHMDAALLHAPDGLDPGKRQPGAAAASNIASLAEAAVHSPHQQAWQQAEAAIDELIAEAERAASSASHLWGEEEAVPTLGPAGGDHLHEQHWHQQKQHEEQGQQQELQQSQQLQQGERGQQELQGQQSAEHKAHLQGAMLRGQRACSSVPAQQLLPAAMAPWSHAPGSRPSSRAGPLVVAPSVSYAVGVMGQEEEDDDEDEELELKYGLRPASRRRGVPLGMQHSWRDCGPYD